MKKLVLMAVAIVAVSFASCGNKAADAAKATADSIRIADSIAAVEAAALEAEQAAAAAAADTLATDSVAAETAE
jgi:rRNA maturation endonuclease Nob1